MELQRLLTRPPESPPSALSEHEYDAMHPVVPIQQGGCVLERYSGRWKKLAGQGTVRKASFV